MNGEPLRITKLVRIGTSLGVVIPCAVLEAINLKRGDQVFVAVREDLSVALKKVDIKIIT